MEATRCSSGCRADLQLLKLWWPVHVSENPSACAKRSNTSIPSGMKPPHPQPLNSGTSSLRLGWQLKKELNHVLPGVEVDAEHFPPGAVKTALSYAVTGCRMVLAGL